LKASVFPPAKSGRLNPNRRLMKIVRHGSLSTLDEQILGAAAEDESTTRIRSENEAKDLMRFLEEDQAFKTMSFFEEESETSRIGKSSLKNWVVNAFRERRALALTLNDTKTAVNKLHQIINAIVLVVSFVFGNTAKTLFESIIFLFVIHPFDVGDRCEIDGVQLIVEEMNILTTFFLRADNQKVLYPNSVFLQPNQSAITIAVLTWAIRLSFHIHICTPAEKVALMKQRITGLSIIPVVTIKKTILFLTISSSLEC
ncbi:hypothetical protein D5086_009176, partial [Populus alba]